MRIISLFLAIQLLSYSAEAQRIHPHPPIKPDIRLAKIDKRINTGFVLLGAGLGTIPIFTGIAVYQLGNGLGNLYGDTHTSSGNILVPAIMITGAALAVTGTVLLTAGLTAKKRHIKLNMGAESPAPLTTILLPHGGMAKHFIVKITLPL